jgi:hypothetical protein
MENCCLCVTPLIRTTKFRSISNRLPDFAAAHGPMAVGIYLGTWLAIRSPTIAPPENSLRHTPQGDPKSAGPRQFLQHCGNSLPPT